MGTNRDKAYAKKKTGSKNESDLHTGDATTTSGKAANTQRQLSMGSTMPKPLAISKRVEELKIKSNKLSLRQEMLNRRKNNPKKWHQSPMARYEIGCGPGAFMEGFEANS